MVFFGRSKHKGGAGSIKRRINSGQRSDQSVVAPASPTVTALLSFSCELRAEIGPVMPPARYQASMHAFVQSRCGALVDFMTATTGARTCLLRSAILPGPAFRRHDQLRIGVERRSRGNMVFGPSIVRAPHSARWAQRSMTGSLIMGACIPRGRHLARVTPDGISARLNELAHEHELVPSGWSS
jgi:hypothetical protein